MDIDTGSDHWHEMVKCHDRKSAECIRASGYFIVICTAGIIVAGYFFYVIQYLLV